MSSATTTAMPNKQMAIRKGDFNTSLNPFTPYSAIRHMLRAVPAAQSKITAMASVIISGVKRNLKNLASWGACSVFMATLYHDCIKKATPNGKRM